MKEATSSPYNKLIFRETFNDESTLKKNGGTPTDVTFADGKGSFNGTSSKILYPLNLKGTYSFRMRFKSFTSVLAAVFFDPRGDGTGSGNIFVNTGTILGSADGTKYINGAAGDALTTSTKEIVVSGLTINTVAGYKTYIGARYSDANYLTADVDLFEIYQGTLTASQVAGLYNNTWNTELSGMGGEPKSNLVVNGGFDTDSGWTKLSGWSISGGKAVATSAADSADLYTSISSQASKRLRVTFDITDYTAGAVHFKFYGSNNLGTERSAIGTYSEYVTVGAAHNGNFGLETTGTTTLKCDNVTVQELNPKTLLDFDSTNGVLEDKTVGNTVGSDKINLNLTSGWSNSMGGEFLDTNSFTTVTSGAVQKTTNVLVSGKKYRCLIKGNFTGEVGNFRISDNGGTVYQYITENDFNYVFEFTHSSIATRIQLQSADSKVRTVNLDYFLLYEIRPDLSATAAGSTNLIIGNNDGATRTFDGIIAKIKVVEGILSQNDITREWSSSRSETQ